MDRHSFFEGRSASRCPPSSRPGTCIVSMCVSVWMQWHVRLQNAAATIVLALPQGASAWLQLPSDMLGHGGNDWKRASLDGPCWTDVTVMALGLVGLTAARARSGTDRFSSLPFSRVRSRLGIAYRYWTEARGPECDMAAQTVAERPRSHALHCGRRQCRADLTTSAGAKHLTVDGRVVPVTR